MIRSPHFSLISVARLTALLVMVVLVPKIGHAQLIFPSAPPPGGQTSRPIITSGLTQQKKGSLIVGRSGSGCDLSQPINSSGRNACARLCLNLALSDYTTGTYGTSTNPTYCISSWTDLTASLKSQYLALLPNATNTNANGYVRIQGPSLTTKPYSVRLTGSSFGGSSALLADGINTDNFAGFLVGQTDVNSSGAAFARICLNGTSDYASASANDQAAGRYCIQNWTAMICTGGSAGSNNGASCTGAGQCTGGGTCSSVPNAIQPIALRGKLTLNTAYPTMSTVDQIGTLNLWKGFRAGGFTLGDPLGVPPAWSCGDGICSMNENTGSCSLDCVTGTGLVTGSVSASSTTTAVEVKVNLGIVDENDPDSTYLVVRSDQPNFAFTPVDGALYPPGGDSTFAVVYNATITPTSVLTVTDSGNGLQSNHTYYYRVYRGNSYPSYSPQTASTSVVYNGTTPPGDGGGGGGSNPPIGGGGGGCFIAGSLVDTPSGPTAIETLGPGDLVYAFDETTKQRVVSTVEHLLIHQPESYGRVTFADGTSLSLTMTHPFYSPLNDYWKAIEFFKFGEPALRYSGLSFRNDPLISRVWRVGTAPVYNLTVRDQHTYYVQGLVVHNFRKALDPLGGDGGLN